MGWDRAGTLNLNIRYGQMTMALLAQAVLHQSAACGLGEPYAEWDAGHLARSLLAGLECDICVSGEDNRGDLQQGPERRETPRAL